MEVGSNSDMGQGRVAAGEEWNDSGEGANGWETDGVRGVAGNSGGGAHGAGRAEPGCHGEDYQVGGEMEESALSLRVLVVGRRWEAVGLAGRTGVTIRFK